MWPFKKQRLIGYAFEPQSDITTYELALIFKFYGLHLEKADKLLQEHPEISRHMRWWEIEV